MTGAVRCKLLCSRVALRNDAAVRVHAALDTLPANYHSVLELCYISDLSYREIAVRLGIPIGTVKTYISRAKRRLRVEFDSNDIAFAMRCRPIV